MFRRQRRTTADEADLAGQQQDAAESELGSDRYQPPDAGRIGGPWDLSEVGAPYDNRVDLGGLLVPAVAGMELRVELANERITAASALLADSELKLQPFAAPRTEGIWDEVRAELAAGITRQGGTVDEVDGPFGVELRARMPIRTAKGTGAVQAARFFGIDGPRWFLHGVLTGRGANEPRHAGPVEDLLRGVVVVRGDTPMAPQELIPLRLPEEAGQTDVPTESGRRPPLNPFSRGPEITEVR